MGSCASGGGVVKNGLSVARVAVVAEGMGIDHFHLKLYPLHGVAAEWKPFWSDRHEWFENYPGFITTALGPQAPRTELEQMRQQIVSGAPVM